MAQLWGLKGKKLMYVLLTKHEIFLTFESPTLSPSGEIIAKISLVFVSAALLAEEAARNMKVKKVTYNRESTGILYDNNLAFCYYYNNSWFHYISYFWRNQCLPLTSSLAFPAHWLRHKRIANTWCRKLIYLFRHSIKNSYSRLSPVGLSGFSAPAWGVAGGCAAVPNSSLKDKMTTKVQNALITTGWWKVTACFFGWLSSLAYRHNMKHKLLMYFPKARVVSTATNYKFA